MAGLPQVHVQFAEHLSVSDAQRCSFLKHAVRIPEFMNHLNL